jgi:hypothetical protein
VTDGLFDVLNLGAGWQSTTLFLMSCRGILPKLDAAVFADTQWEPKGVYSHLLWLIAEGEKAGIPTYQVTAGDLRQDAIDFRRLLASADGKRWASMPLFIKNPDGSQGRVKRQCTREYKIEPCETFIRRHILKLKHKQHAPRDIAVRTWFGISSDEAQRATAPGRWVKKKCGTQPDLYGAVATVLKKKVWKPILWKAHVYPLLDRIMFPDRSSKDSGMLPERPSLGLMGGAEPCPGPTVVPGFWPTTPTGRCPVVRASPAPSGATTSGDSCATPTRRRGRMPSPSTRRSGLRTSRA